MKKCFYRVTEHHSGSGDAHDFSDFFPHRGIVTMRRAVFAGWFPGVEPAMIDSLDCVCQQAFATFAESPFPVHFFAIDGYHCTDCFFFVLKRHGTVNILFLL